MPWVNGMYRWEWALCYKVAAAIARVAKNQGVDNLFCWGGVWDEWMSQYSGDDATMLAAVRAYEARHPGHDFVDGPHFQIYRLR